MKFVTKKFFVVSMFISLLSAKLHAYDTIQGNTECCRASCYECGCNPLYCGALDVQFQAGVAPILWFDRGQIDSITQCGLEQQANPVATLFTIPEFHAFYRLPWIIGGQIGYALSDNARVYLEFNYLQASAKNNIAINTIGVEPNTVVINVDKYRLFEVYIGARHYVDRWCDRISLFMGFKAGLTHHKKVKFSSTITVPPAAPVVLTTDLDLFKGNTVPAGGLHIGLDFCLSGNCSLSCTAELVASCGLKAGGNIAFGQGTASCQEIGPQPFLPQPIPGLNNILIGGIGAEIRFPITAGIRYAW